MKSLGEMDPKAHQGQRSLNALILN